MRKTIRGSEGNQDDEIVGPPPWVKRFALVAVLLIAAFVILLASGHRGPGRHFRSLNAGESSHPPPTGQNEHRP